MYQRRGAPTSNPIPSRFPTLIHPDVDLSEQWRSMGDDSRASRSESPPRTLEEFRETLRCASKAKAKRTMESEEEEDVFYRTSDGHSRDYAGRWFFEWLCPTRPTLARRRVERLYWMAWKQFLYGFFMSGIGTVLMMAGIGCTTHFSEERWRGVGLMFGALLLCIPGYYCLFVLYMYVRCRGRYTYLQLPEM